MIPCYFTFVLAIPEDRKVITLPVLQSIWSNYQGRCDMDDALDCAFGRAVACPKVGLEVDGKWVGDVCDKEYCQSFCHGKGCKFLGECWKVKA
jgi:hypothetical protein